MDFHPFTTNREACSKSHLVNTADEFYAMATAEAISRDSSQFYQQVNSERTWELVRKPYYNVRPSIVPMLTRLNLDLDSGLIQLPLPALCIRLPKQHNPLAFQWRRKRLRTAPERSWEAGYGFRGNCRSATRWSVCSRVQLTTMPLTPQYRCDTFQRNAPWPGARGHCFHNHMQVGSKRDRGENGQGVALSGGLECHVAE